MDKKRGGFTLTEVLIVVGIIAFLAVIFLVYLRTQVFKARDAKRKADMHLIQNAVEEYEKDHDCYPPVSLVVCKPSDGLKPYLNKIPCDPISGKSYLYEPGGPTYCFNWYRMYAMLDNGAVTVKGPGGVKYDYYVSSPNAPTPVPIVSTPTPSSASTPTPSSTPTPIPGGGPWFGCFSGSCEPIFGPPYCSPKFEYNPSCYGECTDEFGQPKSECE